MSTVTVSIGRNVGSVPMSDERWQFFRGNVEGVLLTVGASFFVMDAQSEGFWDGVPEESRTWVADVSEGNLGDLRDMLLHVCWDFHQDAIALTVGATELLGA